jgi:hypothetical protein
MSQESYEKNSEWNKFAFFISNNLKKIVYKKKTIRSIANQTGD